MTVSVSSAPWKKQKTGTSATKNGPVSCQSRTTRWIKRDSTKQSMRQYFDDEVQVKIIEYQHWLRVHGVPVSERQIMNTIANKQRSVITMVTRMRPKQRDIGQLPNQYETQGIPLGNLKYMKYLASCISMINPTPLLLALFLLASYSYIHQLSKSQCAKIDIYMIMDTLYDLAERTTSERVLVM